MALTRLASCAGERLASWSGMPVSFSPRSWPVRDRYRRQAPHRLLPPSVSQPHTTQYSKCTVVEGTEQGLVSGGPESKEPGPKARLFTDHGSLFRLRLVFVVLVLDLQPESLDLVGQVEELVR
jgi:hypothetical protein